MALSRAAAAAARKAAKSRGLKGNRADDGSMLTAKQTAEVDKAMAAVDAYDNMRAKEARKPLTAEEISYKLLAELCSKMSAQDWIDLYEKSEPLESVIQAATFEKFSLKINKALDSNEIGLIHIKSIIVVYEFIGSKIREDTAWKFYRDYSLIDVPDEVMVDYKRIISNSRNFLKFANDAKFRQFQIQSNLFESVNFFFPIAANFL